jgi:HNH endonuclease
MSERIRNFIRNRAEGRCEYCRLPDHADEWPFHVEHIVARQHGGDDQEDNLCWACIRCNVRKGTNLVSIDPQTGLRANLFDPRRQRWNDHFVIQDARILGLTASGRCTVRLLQMNDFRRVELRRELISMGML